MEMLTRLRLRNKGGNLAAMKVAISVDNDIFKTMTQYGKISSICNKDDMFVYLGAKITKDNHASK